MTQHQQEIRVLLDNPEKLIKRTPYTRQVEPINHSTMGSGTADINQLIEATIPAMRSEVVSEAELLAELDPFSHKILKDENIPSITVKCSDGKYLDIEYARMPVPAQRNILDKQVLHLCSNPMAFTLLNDNPTDDQQRLFMVFKQAWEERNMDGLKTDFVRKAKSQGSAGLLFYYDYRGRVKARTLAYEDGYQICTHRDANGEHILETVYYCRDNVRYIDSYDDTYLYRYTDDATPGDKDAIYRNGWRWHQPVAHGFNEIPLVTKHTRVAWDRVQYMIEVFEVILNIFAVCQKKYGWGILYVKGQFNPQAKKIAGAQVLNDTSLDPNADARFLTPPSADNMISYLEFALNLIQLGSGTTFILPKDIKISGDTSGLAIQLTQELDMETARNGISEWQNCASKMARLFAHGYARELVNNGHDIFGDSRFDTAITDFAKLRISARFQLWRPQSDSEYNQQLVTLYGSGGISLRTFIEKNTASTPDELARISKETAETEVKQIQQQDTTTNTDTTNQQ